MAEQGTWTICSSIFLYSRIESLAIRFAHAAIKEVDLVKTVQALSEEGIFQVHEFTTVVDQREFPETVGFVLEVTGDIGMAASRSDFARNDACWLGPNANIARQKAFEAIVRTNAKHKDALDSGQLSLPTVRIVKNGTFAGYRRWRGERMNVSVGQMKVPVVMADSDSLAWLMEKIVREL